MLLFGCEPISLHLPPLAANSHSFQRKRREPFQAAQCGPLRDISPTLLSILKIGEPKEMTGGDLRVAITK